jgi:hypothetical protein
MEKLLLINGLYGASMKTDPFSISGITGNKVISSFNTTI